MTFAYNNDDMEALRREKEEERKRTFQQSVENEKEESSVKPDEYLRQQRFEKYREQQTRDILDNGVPVKEALHDLFGGKRKPLLAHDLAKEADYDLEERIPRQLRGPSHKTIRSLGGKALHVGTVLGHAAGQDLKRVWTHATTPDVVFLRKKIMRNFNLDEDQANQYMMKHYALDLNGNIVKKSSDNKPSVIIVNGREEASPTKSRKRGFYSLGYPTLPSPEEIMGTVPHTHLRTDRVRANQSTVVKAQRRSQRQSLGEFRVPAPTEILGNSSHAINTFAQDLVQSPRSRQPTFQQRSPPAVAQNGQRSFRTTARGVEEYQGGRLVRIHPKGKKKQRLRLNPTQHVIDYPDPFAKFRL